MLLLWHGETVAALGTEGHHLPTLLFRHLPLVPQTIPHYLSPLCFHLTHSPRGSLLPSRAVRDGQTHRLTPEDVSPPCQPVIFSLPQLASLLLSGLSVFSACGPVGKAGGEGLPCPILVWPGP